MHSSPKQPRGPVRLDKVFEEELGQLETDVDNFRAGVIPGISTGFSVLDTITAGGLRRTGISLIAARTGVGKTALALNIMRNAAEKGFTCGYWTVEMTAGQLARRLWAMSSGIKGTKLMVGNLSDEEIDRLFGAAQLFPRDLIYIDDSFATKFEVFEAAVRELKAKGKLDLVVVDYIQQLTLSGRHGSRREMLQEISHRLKQLAIELDIAVVALAQFNREAEKSEEEPALWQVKDSGALEQDADLGVCLFRDSEGTFYLKIDKNRWGPDKQRFVVDADLSISRFKNANINLGDF